MNELLLGSGVVVSIVYAVASTAAMMNAGRTSAAVRYVVKSAGGNLNNTLLELQGTLWNVNKITSDISTVRRDVRLVADTVIKLGKYVRYLYQYLKNELSAAAGAHSPD